MSKPNVGEQFLISLLRAVAHEQKTLGVSLTDKTQIQWAITIGLGPLLRQFVCGTRSLIPETCAHALLLSELQAKVKIKRQLHATEEIIDACYGLAGTLTLLKGISICEQYYSEAYLRPMVDLDLLVRKSDVAAVEAALRQLNYTKVSTLPERFYESHHHSMPFLHPRTHVCVEVHTALFPPQSGIGKASVFSVQNVSTHLRPSTFHGRDVFRLSAELELLYIASHAVCELRIFRTLIPVLDTLLL
ncbi:MAG: nucleotidyltransferase family protein, partial [Gammaproteobacteria bacterium]